MSIALIIVSVAGDKAVEPTTSVMPIEGSYRKSTQAFQLRDLFAAIHDNPEVNSCITILVPFK